jgi:imidazoleglycerol-phosphate dehydratase / histidinol-phosphatase
MKKALFIDRDGTLIVEPPVTFQVDTLEQLEFLPGVFRNLYFIQKNLDYELIIVSNQDGLGTESYPQARFDLIQAKMLQAFYNEGIKFDNILIDKSFPEENLPTRKPATGLLSNYMTGEYDLASSFVIGDRLTDLKLAQNLGAKGILIGESARIEEVKANGLENSCDLIAADWNTVYQHVALPQRTATVVRTTKETDIQVSVNIDGSGTCLISTGLGFFDHMLEQIGRHGGFDLTIQVKGDLNVDEHHTIEDTALALGEAVAKAIGSKAGMERYGYCLPMDDCLAQVALDFGGRPWLVWNTSFSREKVGDVPTEMFLHFFKSFSDASKSNLNVQAEGENEHHKIEGIFKAFARALKMAVRRDPFNFQLPSTKGVL